ncbi:Uncharacterised protein r2_g482 [Pycnogonum litorale]
MTIEKETGRMKGYFYRNIGVFGGIFCGICNASMEIAGKSMTLYYSPAEVTFLRYLIHFPLNIAIILAAKDAFKPSSCEIKYLLTKGIFLSFSHLCLYTSFTSLPYFDSFVVAYGVMVIFSIILGRIWLKERVSAYTLSTVVLMISGILLIAHPAFQMKSKDIVGYLCSVGSGICMGVAGCANRKIKETPSTTVTFYIAVCALPVSIIAMAIVNDFKLPYDYNTVFTPLFIGCCSVAMHVVWSKGLQLSDVSKIMLAVQCEIPIGFILQWIFFREMPHFVSIIGSCCILLGIIFMVLEYFVMSFITKLCASAEQSHA